MGRKKDHKATQLQKLYSAENNPFLEVATAGYGKFQKFDPSSQRTMNWYGKDVLIVGKVENRAEQKEK